MCIDFREGKHARTVFQVLERFPRWTLLKCQPLTNRVHQIRVHLKRAKLPIVGDVLYGGGPLLLSSLKRGYRLKSKRTERPLIGELVLHAESATFAHPVTGVTLNITAPWPKDLQVAVKYLRRYGGHSPLITI